MLETALTVLAYVVAAWLVIPGIFMLGALVCITYCLVFDK